MSNFEITVTVIALGYVGLIGGCIWVAIRIFKGE
jgi:hypothetical protein